MDGDRSSNVEAVMNRLSARAILVATGLVAALCVVPASATADASSNYVVLYREGASTSQAQGTIAAAGGTVLATYPQIGVLVARSSSAGFGATLRGNGNVEGVAATGRFATRQNDDSREGLAPTVAAATWGDSLSGGQWDMVQIHAPEAQAINP